MLILGWRPAPVQSKLRHLGEYLIPDPRLKHLEVGDIKITVRYMLSYYRFINLFEISFDVKNKPSPLYVPVGTSRTMFIIIINSVSVYRVNATVVLDKPSFRDLVISKFMH